MDEAEATELRFRVAMLEATVRVMAAVAVPAALAGNDPEIVETALRDIAEGHLMPPSAEQRETRKLEAEAAIRLADAISERVALQRAGLL